MFALFRESLITCVGHRPCMLETGFSHVPVALMGLPAAVFDGIIILVA